MDFSWHKNLFYQYDKSFTGFWHIRCCTIERIVNIVHDSDVPVIEDKPVDRQNGIRDMKMIKTGIHERLHGLDVERNMLEPVVFHEEYEVRSESGNNLGIQLLVFYFGELWISAMNRLNHKIDGHLFDIRHQGACYAVYRNLETNPVNEHPHLRLVEKKS
jgi:hypothetical protein